MPTVTFVNEKVEIQVPEGANLRKEARNAGIEVYSGVNKVLHCPGFGMCGTCRVLITKGMENASPMGLIENFTFHNVLHPVPPQPCTAFIGNEKTMRLSCQTKVLGDMQVVTRPPMNWCGENFFS